MLTILIHSSKTMRPHGPKDAPYQQPVLLDKASELGEYLKTLTVKQIEMSMKLSPTMSVKTKQLIDEWNADPTHKSPAIDTFLGDIYSGLQVRSFDEADRQYANDHLFILSGLYGVLRALDSIRVYRLEMAYKFPDKKLTSLYRFWGNVIANNLPANRPIINVSSVEYTKAVLPHLPGAQIIAPKFMTRDTRSGEPKFVTVHAKVARGAFAHWLIKNRVESVKNIRNFDELSYRYDTSLSTENEPVFVCDQFGGLGLSVRAVKNPPRK